MSDEGTITLISHTDHSLAKRLREECATYRKYISTAIQEKDKEGEEGVSNLLKHAEYILENLPKQLTKGISASSKTNQAFKEMDILCGEKLSVSDQNTFVVHFYTHFKSLKMGLMNAETARIVLGLIRSTMSSKTKNTVRVNYGYVFGKAFGSGGGKSYLLKAMCEDTGELFCAKIFPDYGNTRGCIAAEHEYNSSKTLGIHPNIVLVHKLISFTHESGDKNALTAIMMPIFNLSLSELILSYPHHSLPFPIFKSIALGLFSAVTRFQEVGLVHADIKPDNIMMTELSPILIDFGSVTHLGCTVLETTEHMALDAGMDKVDFSFDLCCIASTLCFCFIVGFERKKRTRGELLREIRDYRLGEDGFDGYRSICSAFLETENVQVSQLLLDNGYSMTSI